MKILFVCRGNVVRSQMAEVIFKLLNNKHDVSSAGTKVVSPTTGESRHGQLLKDTKGAESVLIALKERGVEVAENVRTQLNPEMVEWADKIVVMAEPETIPDYLARSSKTVYWEIKDPRNTPLEEHKAIMNQIEARVKSFIEDNTL